jgi:hypothetical protein
MSTTAKVLAAAALTAIAAGAAIPAITGANVSAGRTITVRDKVQQVQFIHQDASTPGEQLAFGDRVITRQGTFDSSDRAIGTLTTDCVNVGPAAEVFEATLQCTSIYSFKNGQIVAVGVVRLDNPSVRIAVTGGTGAYAKARGEVGAGKPVKGYDTVDVIRLGA